MLTTSAPIYKQNNIWSLSYATLRYSWQSWCNYILGYYVSRTEVVPAPRPAIHLRPESYLALMATLPDVGEAQARLYWSCRELYTLGLLPAGLCQNSKMETLRNMN